MSNEENRWHKKDKPTYLMVPRKFVIAIIAGFLVLFVSNIMSFQYANYVDRKSNRLLCGIIVLSDNASQATPPRTDIERSAAQEFKRLRNSFHCK